MICGCSATRSDIQSNAAFACGVWMLLAHMLLPRSGVVRAELTDEGVRFGGAPGIRIPLLLLAPIGLVMLGAWLWALVTASERLTVLTIVLVPVLALLLMYGGGRTIFGAPAAPWAALDSSFGRAIGRKTGLHFS